MSNLALTPVATLMTETQITVTDIPAVQSALLNYETAHLANFSACYPDTRIAELRAAIASASDLSTLPTLEAEIAALEAGGDDAMRNARGKVFAEFATARAAIITLCQHIETLLAGYRTTAQAAEDGFFDTYAQPHMRTLVSTRYTTALAQVVGMRQAWQAVQPATLPNVYAINVLLWLGVTDPLGGE